MTTRWLFLFLSPRCHPFLPTVCYPLWGSNQTNDARITSEQETYPPSRPRKKKIISAIFTQKKGLYLSKIKKCFKALWFLIQSLDKLQQVSYGHLPRLLPKKKTVVYLCACVLTPSLSAVSHSSHGTRTTKKKFYLPPRFFFCRKFPLFWTGPSDNRKIPPLPTRFFPYKYLCKPPFCPDIAYLELFFFTQFFFFTSPSDTHPPPCFRK